MEQRGRELEGSTETGFLTLEHTLPIEKLLEQEKFLKASPIMQRQAPPPQQTLTHLRLTQDSRKTAFQKSGYLQ